MSDQVRSPFKNQLLPDKGDAPKPGDAVDHNECPYFSEPRAPGHGGAPEVFFTEVNGSTHHGDKGEKGAVSSTMGSSKP